LAQYSITPDSVQRQSNLISNLATLTYQPARAFAAIDVLGGTTA